MRGGMRLVFGFEDAQLSQNKGERMVSKCSRFLDDSLNKREVVEAHVKSAAVGEHFASLFSKMLSRRGNKPVTIKFLPCFLYEIEGDLEKDCEARCFAAEPLLPGAFVKYNSNAGYVSDESLQHHEVVQAFMHFSFKESNGEYLVADLQGVARHNEVTLTDPQVLSCRRSFGPGDLGQRGMRLCLASHRCGPTCRLLGLEPVSHTLLRKMGGQNTPASSDVCQPLRPSWPSRFSSGKSPNKDRGINQGLGQIQLRPLRPSSLPSSGMSSNWERISELGAEQLQGFRPSSRPSSGMSSNWENVSEQGADSNEWEDVEDYLAESALDDGSKNSPRSAASVSSWVHVANT
jgi:hypothetical protein